MLAYRAVLTHRSGTGQPVFVKLMSSMMVAVADIVLLMTEAFVGLFSVTGEGRVKDIPPSP